MPVKPSDSEEEYFKRQDAERLRKLAEEHQATMEQEERERLRSLHFMRCPKCGMELREIEFGGVRIDKCFNCEGVWLDGGELDTVLSKGGGFLKSLGSVFRR